MPSRSLLHNRSKRCAFSYIELVIVLLIMGIMASTAAPRLLDSLSYQRASMAARRLKSDIELAQHLAKQRSSSISVEIYESYYTLSNVSDPNHPSQPYTVDWFAQPYNLATPCVHDFTSNAIVFTGHGMPVEGGSVTLTIGKYTQTIIVDGLSGTVSIEESTAVTVPLGP